jgi:hypothetical protein
MVVEAKAGARVLPRYARILGGSQGRAHREASEAARACLAAMRFRFPEALYLVELVIRLGEVGAVDLAGSVRQIAKMIGEFLGEPPPDPVRLQRALRALDEKTCLVKKASRLRWMLCLAGISDPGSKRHRDLLKETPIPLRLGTAAERRPDRHANAGVDDLALRQCLEETVSKLREAEAERDAARAAQADLERQLRAARAEVERLGSEAERLRGERNGTDDAGQDPRAALEVVRDERMQQVDEQETELGALREQLAARDAELAAERERRQLAEDARAREVAALEDAMKAQAAAANAECRQLEEAVLDRDIMLEDAERQLAALRAEIEAATNERA